MERITSFTGKYDFLANSYRKPFRYAGVTYPSAEACYYAQKCKSDEEKKQFAKDLSCDELRTLNKRYNDSLPEIWDDLSEDIMYYLLESKFYDRELKNRLLETKDAEIVYENTSHDNKWGCCTCEACRNKEHKNILGKNIMMIRGHLINIEKYKDDDDFMSFLCSAPLTYHFGSMNEKQRDLKRATLIPHCFSDNQPEEIRNFLYEYSLKLKKMPFTKYYVEKAEIVFGYGDRLYKITNDTFNIDGGRFEANAKDLLNELYKVGCNYGYYYGAC